MVVATAQVPITHTFKPLTSSPPTPCLPSKPCPPTQRPTCYLPTLQTLPPHPAAHRPSTCLPPQVQSSHQAELALLTKRSEGLREQLQLQEQGRKAAEAQLLKADQHLFRSGSLHFAVSRACGAAGGCWMGCCLAG